MLCCFYWYLACLTYYGQCHNLVEKVTNLRFFIDRGYFIKKFVFRTEFKVVTDHLPLNKVFDQIKSKNPRIQRWALYLQDYSFTRSYKVGRFIISRTHCPETIPKTQMPHFERAEGVNTSAPEHHLRPMCGQESLIPLELLLSLLFLRQQFFCLYLDPHFRTPFSSSTSFYSPYFPIVLSRTSPPKILLSMPVPAFFPYIPLPVPAWI